MELDKVGVYLVSYEVVPILIQAQNHLMLDRVKWYGSDSSGRMKPLLEISKLQSLQ